MLTQNDIKITKACFLLDGVDVGELIALGGANITEIKKGDVVFGSSDNQYSIGLLLSGKATAVCSAGDKSALKAFSEGDLFGAASIFCTNQKNDFSKIKATTFCRVLFIERKCVEALLTEKPEKAIEYIRFLSDRVEFLNRRIGTFTSNQATVRLAKYILENANNNLSGISFSALARGLDISRASFYRAKDELEASGAVVMDAKKIMIVDEKVLKTFLDK